MLEAIQRAFSGEMAEIATMSPVVIIASLFVLTFISEDAACLGAGALAAQGTMTPAAAVLTCFTGIVVGDVALYGIGRLFGSRLLNGRYAGSVRRAGKWLERKGAAAVFASRFVTGLRLPTYLAAGFFRTNFKAFLFYFLLAAAVWTPIAVGVSYFSSGLFAQSIFLGLVAAFVTIRLILKLTVRENRRLLVGRWRRIVNWEFWPVWIFYVPVVFYCALLAIRFRSLTVFTAADPGIIGGGLLGESKDAIYGLLSRSDAARSSMLKHFRMPSNLSIETRLQVVAEFMRRCRLSFPVVLKPDVGERGKGVTIAQGWDDVENYLANTAGDTIVQEFFEGVEASVFYYRFPTERRGTIFSITEKVFPAVTGDGISDLRTLILADDRGVVLSQSYFRQNRKDLDTVPVQGEVVRLIDIGTHSRGAIFVDGDGLRTAKLERAVDEICRGVQGFYFGRFDLRARTWEDFQNGGPFRIIELNGVSSESTNIYDPKFNLLDAYRILFRQWRLAFEIGDANRQLGIQPTPLLTMIQLALGIKGAARQGIPAVD